MAVPTVYTLTARVETTATKEVATILVVAQGEIERLGHLAEVEVRCP
jgi:hypothetical protein